MLINNAGVAPLERLDILEAGEASFDRLININLKGPYFLTQKAARWMIRQKERDDALMPVIINLASVSSYAPSIDRGDYCISKAGVSMMTKLYAQRLAAHGIRVYEIRPGVIKTDMTASVREQYQERIDAGLTPIKRWGYPVDIAKAVVAIAQDLLPFSTGEVINVDGGFHLRIL
jgi:NAD(P)-dependent dehydrogenase (short-subunit alcohol dehydrogenase family)